MANELANLRIDQLDTGIPTTNDWGVFRDMANNKTKKYKLPVATDYGNFEWSSVSALAGDYDIGDVVTKGGTWWQSEINNNPSVPGENADWLEIPQSNSGFVLWEAGVYPQDNVLVLSDHRGYFAIYRLVEATRPYVSADIAAEEAAGDWELLLDNKYSSELVAAGDLALNMLFSKRRSFTLDDDVDGDKIWTLSQDLNAQEFDILFNVTGSDGTNRKQTLPATFRMDDPRFFLAENKWTPASDGLYFGHAVKIGAIWKLTISEKL